MDYTRLGSTGLKVSRLALGCMSYGDPTTPNAHPWALNDNDAQPFFRQAVELGVTVFDTSPGYGNGRSEEVLGGALRRHRAEAVIVRRPIPGHENIVSVTMAPASKEPNCSPITVSTGIIALRSACL